MNGPSADCPENSTSEEPLPVPASNAIASPATARPTTGVASSIRRSTWGRRNSPSHRIPEPIRAASTPIASAQPNSAPVGVPTWGRPGIARENVPSPVRWSRPRKISEPTPAASRPGTSTSSSMAPASPEASISRNAPSSGEPSSVLMAAKLPAAATTVAVLGGASRLTRRTARTPSPPPRAIRGASGPSTTPRLRVANAASTMPGSSAGAGGPPPTLNPSAGEWPPLAGQVPDGQSGQQPGQQQRRDRPPQRLGGKAQALGQVGEDPHLQLGDQGEK